jgi:small GTP-binding protein
MADVLGNESGCSEARERLPPAPMADQGELERIARRLAALSADQPNLAQRAGRLADRIAAQRFHIAVLGEFKRGKSTLVNALIGRSLLPSGVVPLTAVATEVHFGSASTTVVFADGRRMALSPEAIGDYVTERGNPSNIKHVDRVEVGVTAVLGAPGLVLVDTPGVASVNELNTAAAHAALIDSDAAVLVLSADSPLSQSEDELLTELRERRAKVFVVINKADHLTEPELHEVQTFVSDHLHRTFSEDIEPYCVSARAALDEQAGDSPASRGFTAFRDALARFVVEDLATARRISVIDELGRLGRGLDQSLQIEAAAEALDAQTLSTQLARFEAAAGDGRRQLQEDRVVLDHDISSLAGDLGRRLSSLADAEAQACRPLLAAKAASLARWQLDSGLRQVIEACVRERFDPVRRDVEGDLETAWEAVAARFAGRVQARVDELVNVANELFDVHLPTAPVPTVTEQREHFSYLFVHVEGPSAIIGRALVTLLPAGTARRRAIRAAQRRLHEEFDKHAGRSRHDLAERLEETKRYFVAAMVAEFDPTEASVLGAAESARTLLALTKDERRRRDRARDDIRVVVAGVAQIVARDG